jgi:hypothetical protein
MDPNDYTAQIALAADQQRRISAAQQASMAQAMMNQTTSSLNGALGMGAINQVWSGQNAATFPGAKVAGAPKTAPRVFIEVDIVTNGYVLHTGSDLLIAKDLEELQQHFTAAIAAVALTKDD